MMLKNVMQQMALIVFVMEMNLNVDVKMAILEETANTVNGL